MAIKTTHSHTHHLRPRTAPKTRAPIDLSAPVRAVLFDIDGTLLDTRDAMAHQLVQEIVPGDRDLVFPGVREGLDELRAQGVKLAAVTSNEHSAGERILRCSGLWNRVDVLVGADDVAHPMPHPEAVERALTTLLETADHTVLVGDTQCAVQMGQALGMRTIGAGYGVSCPEALAATVPTWVVSSFCQIGALLSGRIATPA